MRLAKIAIALACGAAAAASPAALKQGTSAPDFTTTGALAGKPFKLHLKEQLRKGPVVLYFYPKAFTQGCTLEAHAFSEAAADFRKAGARVIGLSGDDYETLRRFSVEECRNSFPVATAAPATIDAYDVRLKPNLQLASRTSYVIAPDGKIVYAYSNPDWREHVTNTLAAVKAWKQRKR